MLLVLFLLVALWQGTAASMARSDESPASTVSRTLIQNAGLLITMDPKLGEGPLGTVPNADLLFAGDAIFAGGEETFRGRRNSDRRDRCHFNVQPSNVSYAFVDGRPLKANGQFIGLSRMEVVKAAEASTARLREAVRSPGK